MAYNCEKCGKLLFDSLTEFEVTFRNNNAKFKADYNYILVECKCGQEYRLRANIDAQIEKLKSSKIVGNEYMPSQNEIELDSEWNFNLTALQKNNLFSKLTQNQKDLYDLIILSNGIFFRIKEKYKYNDIVLRKDAKVIIKEIQLLTGRAPLKKYRADWYHLDNSGVKEMTYTLDEWVGEA
jgi:hypothetical protein